MVLFILNLYSFYITIQITYVTYIHPGTYDEHLHMYAHVSAHVYAHVRVYLYTCTHTAHTGTQAHTCMPMYTCMYTHTAHIPHTHVHIQAHTCTHAYVLRDCLYRVCVNYILID